MPSAASLTGRGLSSRPCLPTLVPVLCLRPWYRPGGQGLGDPSGGNSSKGLFPRSVLFPHTGDALGPFEWVFPSLPHPSRPACGLLPIPHLLKVPVVYPVPGHKPQRRQWRQGFKKQTMILKLEILPLPRCLHLQGECGTLLALQLWEDQRPLGKAQFPGVLKSLDLN